MTIIVVGLNIQPCPIETQEKWVHSGCTIDDLRDFIAEQAHETHAHLAINEAVLVSTRDRLEVIASSYRPAVAIVLIKQFIAHKLMFDQNTLDASLYTCSGDEALGHLMRMACDANHRHIVQAFEDACNAEMTGMILSHLFTSAIHTGKHKPVNNSRTGEIIQQEIARFNEWYRGRQISPIIEDLHEWAQRIANQELAQSLNRLSTTDEQTRQIVSQMAQSLVNRLLHDPTHQLNTQIIKGSGYGYARAIQELFALNTPTLLECQHEEIACPISEQVEEPSHRCALQCIVPSTGVRNLQNESEAKA